MRGVRQVVIDQGPLTIREAAVAIRGGTLTVGGNIQNQGTGTYTLSAGLPPTVSASLAWISAKARRSLMRGGVLETRD